MENNFDNTHSDLIYLFLDREATPLEQEILFKALSENSDLRAEFENALEIYSGFKSDKNNLNPPVHLATSLFSAAGMTYPNGYNSTATGSIPNSKFLPMLKNIIKPAIFLFIGSLLTFFSLLLFNSNENNIDSVSRAILSSSDFEQNHYNLVNSFFNNNISTETTTIRNSSDKDFEKAVIQSFESGSSNLNNSLKQSGSDKWIGNTVLPEKVNLYSSLELNDNLQPKKAFVKSSFGFNSPLFLNEPVRNPEFYLELKGNSSLNQFPINSTHLSLSQIYENLGLGLYYKIGQNNLVGAYISNEPFNIYKVNDPEYAFDFTPVSKILTYGASFRQLLPVFNLNGYLTPFVDVSTGFSEYGVVTKGAIGLNLNPNNLFNFVIGLDGTMLFYKFRGNVQTTEKISVFFNIGFNL